MYKELNEAVNQVAEEIRKQCADRDISAIKFEIIVSGRVDGELLIAYSIDHEYEYNTKSSGGDIQAVVQEFFHRQIWNKRNAPKALAKPRAVTVSDETPI